MSAMAWLLAFALVVAAVWVVGAVADYLCTHSPVARVCEAARTAAVALPAPPVWLRRIPSYPACAWRLRAERARHRCIEEH